MALGLLTSFIARSCHILLSFFLFPLSQIVAIGSVHDQAVPLYSSLIQAFPSSPNLLRGIYIDYSTYQPDFLYAILSLVVYCMNVGIHGGSLNGHRNGEGNTLSEIQAANVYIEALVHISGWLRGGILEKNGGAHSAVHRLTDCYKSDTNRTGLGIKPPNIEMWILSLFFTFYVFVFSLGIEWSLSGRGVSTPVHVHSHSFAAWAPYFQESFTHTRMNRYMLVLRFRELFTILPLTPLKEPKYELRQLHRLYHHWQPRTKQLKHLKDTFAILFETQVLASSSTSASSSSSSAHTDSSASKDSESKKESRSDDSSSSSSSSPFVPLSDLSLTDLLTRPHLSILPVSMPASWSLTLAPNHSDLSHSSHACTDTESNGNGTGGGGGGGNETKGRRNNKRLRHVNVVPEEEMMDIRQMNTITSSESGSSSTEVPSVQPLNQSQQFLQLKSSSLPLSFSKGALNGPLASVPSKLWTQIFMRTLNCTPRVWVLLGQIPIQ